MSWEPILHGELAERALDAIRGIRDSIAKTQAFETDAALFWSYLPTVLDDATTAGCLDSALERVAQRLESGVGGIRLHGGLPGTGWVVAHVVDDVDEMLATIDTPLLDMVAVDRWSKAYDLIGGLAGLAVYFLERGPAPAATIGLARICDHIVKLAERTPRGATWHTAAALLPEHQRRVAPDGYYNCGLAHGVAGVVGALARIAKRPDAPAGCGELLADAVRWLRAQQLADGTFPSWIDPSATSTRTAWCYGAPGVALALARAGVAGDDLARLNAWIDLPIERTGVVDAGLCHGSAGLAHICNRFYQATGEPAYRAAAIKWFEQTLAFRGREGVGGFLMYIPSDTTTPWQPSSRLLDGAIGVALALIAAVTPVEPEWDRQLMCDLPLRP